MDPTQPFDLTTLLNYGALGLIVLALLFGYLWSKPSVDDLKEQLRKTEKQRDDSVELWNTTVIPLLQDFNEATKSLIPILQALVNQQMQNSSQRRPPRRHD